MPQTKTPAKKIKISNLLATLLIILFFLVGFSSGIIYANNYLVQPVDAPVFELPKTTKIETQTPKGLTISVEELQTKFFKNAKKVTIKRQAATSTIGGILQPEGYREYNGDSKTGNVL